MNGATDQFIDCLEANCRFPNRPVARFCAQCGRELELPQQPQEHPMPTPRSAPSGFLLMPGGTITRLDHLGAALSWCLALAGMTVLVVSLASIAGRIVGG